MKQTKKLASLLLALVMVLSLVVNAAAVDVTINNSATGHTYEAYQIFTGRLENGTLSDVVWGSGVNPETFITKLKAHDALKDNVKISALVAADSDTTKQSTAADVADAISSFGNVFDSETAKAIAECVGESLTSTVAGSCSTPVNGKYVIKNLAAGYYLIKDQNGTITGNDSYTRYILEVTDAVEITPKGNIPEVDKNIGTIDNIGTPVNAADYSLHDDVPFTLKGTLPSNYADYKTYKYVFHDTLSAGLTYKEDAKVWLVNGDSKSDITESFNVAHNNGTLTVSCDDLKSIAGVSIDSSSIIVVEYTAKLNENAAIGSPTDDEGNFTGNKNTVYLEFSNNPNGNGDGDGDGTPDTGKTPNDEVLVFTYELDVTKVDGQDDTKKLTGAEFVLLNNDKSKVAKVEDGKFVEWVDVPAAVEGKITYPAGTTLTSDNDGKFAIAGLDAGKYYLRETKAPAGYNLLKDDIAVVIAATLDQSKDPPALTALTIQIDSGSAANGNLATGVVSTDVKNNSGAVLPETGGIGTTIFYIVGGVLFVGAAVLLVVKRRMNMKG